MGFWLRCVRAVTNPAVLQRNKQRPEEEEEQKEGGGKRKKKVRTVVVNQTSVHL